MYTGSATPVMIMRKIIMWKRAENAAAMLLINYWDLRFNSHN